MRCVTRTLSLLAMLGCVPPPHPLIGKACDADNLCPGALYCVDGLCSESPPSDVVVLSSEFEPSIDQWEGVNATRVSATTQHRSGAGGLRVSANDGALALTAQSKKASVAVGTGRHCATAWVLHSPDANAPIIMRVKAFGGAGGAAVISQSDGTLPSAIATVPSTGRVFQKVSAELVVDAATASAVTVTFDFGAGSPAEFYVDDVLMVRAFGACAPTN